jgi:hypothetical protein
MGLTDFGNEVSVFRVIFSGSNRSSHLYFRLGSAVALWSLIRDCKTTGDPGTVFAKLSKVIADS